MSMRLYISRSNPANAEFSTEDGRVLYKTAEDGRTTTVVKLIEGDLLAPDVGSTNDAGGHWGGKKGSGSSSSSSSSESETDNKKKHSGHFGRRLWRSDRKEVSKEKEDKHKHAAGHSAAADSKPEKSGSRYAFLASIQWHFFTNPTTFRIGGTELTEYRMFRTTRSRASQGTRDRIFTAPDGEDYKWLGYILGEPTRLVTDDIYQSTVAVFYGKDKHGFEGVVRPKGYIEITPLGEDIVDWIVTTFLFINTQVDRDPPHEEKEWRKAHQKQREEAREEVRKRVRQEKFHLG